MYFNTSDQYILTYKNYVLIFNLNIESYTRILKQQNVLIL